MKFITNLVTFMLLAIDLFANNTSDNVLNIKVESKRFEHMTLCFNSDVRKRIRIEGQMVDNETWSFIYPDSIFDSYTSTIIELPSGVDTIYRIMGFVIPLEKDTIRVSSLNFKKENSFLKMKYQETSVYEKEYGSKDLHVDQFIVDPVQDTELDLATRIFNHFYLHLDDYTYDELKSFMLNLIYKNPNSHVLLNSLKEFTSYFRRKKDQEELFSHFSIEQKKSPMGVRINKLIYDTFENIELTNSLSNEKERIVQEEEKLSLVIFSASWCSPCHKQIPILKKIYTDLHEKINITYVTIDEVDALPAWNELQKKENIQWRSLYIKNEMDLFKENNNIRSIPYALLVYPDKTKEQIDVRVLQDVKKLYTLAK